jgi:hypothetical protein
MLVGVGQWVVKDDGLRPVVGHGVESVAVEVLARSGHRLIGAPAVGARVARDGRLLWSRLEEVRPGDFAVVRYGGMWPRRSPSLTGFVPSASYGNQKKVRVPGEMTAELAFFLGAYVAEGHLNRSNWSVVVTNAVPIAMTLSTRANLSVLLLGGRVRSRTLPGKAACLRRSVRQVHTPS